MSDYQKLTTHVVNGFVDIKDYFSLILVQNYETMYLKIYKYLSFWTLTI